jgi:hypothetical protein
LPGYKVAGDFQGMMYFCPDIRFNFLDKKNKGQFLNKSDDELLNELSAHLSGLSTLAYSWLEDKLIKDYWLVITPLLCDQIKNFDKNAKLPTKDNNYIVTPFYTDNIEFVKNLYKTIPHSYGSLEEHPDPRRRKGTYAEIGFYLACEVNPEDYDEANELNLLPVDTKEYRDKLNLILLRLELELGEQATKHIKYQVRVFMQYGSDKLGIRFVEQYFNHKVPKKTNGYSLGEGYIRNRMGKVNLNKNEKYVVFPDLFASSGYQFSEYALSKGDLRNLSTAFESDPWIQTFI